MPASPRFPGLSVAVVCQGLTVCFCLIVAHRPGAFKAELSKLVIVAKEAHGEL
jgi:hypothetical protein